MITEVDEVVKGFVGVEVEDGRKRLILCRRLGPRDE